MNPQMFSQMLMKTHNPVLMQLSQNMQALTQALNVTKGKTPQEIEQYVRNTVQTQGVDLNQIAQRMGIRLPQ